MLVVVGLGNPGPCYARHRHNVGYQVVERLAETLDTDGWRERHHGLVARARDRESDILLLRPQTFMNDSGRSVRAVTHFFRVSPGDLIVVYDDLDLPFGTLRLKPGGGHGGHNGLRSIMRVLQASDFTRLRFGIGKPLPPFSGEMADYVLSDFGPAERDVLPDLVDRAVAALRLALRRGLGEAMKSLNTRARKPRSKPKPSGESPPSSADGISTDASTGAGDHQEVVAIPTEKR